MQIDTTMTDFCDLASHHLMRALLCCVLFSLGPIGCDQDADDGTVSEPARSEPTASPSAPPAPEPIGESDDYTITIEMRGIAYQAPGGGNVVTIGLGDRVRWVNLDGTMHTVTSTSVPEGGKGFNSGRILPGGEHFFRPNVTGTWTYYCQQYPDRMVGARLIVVP